MSILGNVVKNSTAISDEVIATNMIAASKGSANAYLNAALTSPTPELKAMYASSLTQVLNGHSAITELAIKRGWEEPYNPPTQQLSSAYYKAERVIQKGE
ncbi:MAG: spore coat protein [Clostridiaceae bacterium]|mgnify:CR=1 FL=1|nr:spore coat protein [Clostridiaceae bacterium]